jgi:hypothetical protein
MAFFVFCELRLEVIVYFVDIGGIVDHHLVHGGYDCLIASLCQCL